MILARLIEMATNARPASAADAPAAATKKSDQPVITDESMVCIVVVRVPLRPKKDLGGLPPLSMPPSLQLARQPKPYDF